MLAAFHKLGAGLTDLLFPPRCLTCGDLAPVFCAACRATVRRPGAEALVPLDLTDARSLGYHEERLRDAVLRLKFGGKTALAAPLGELLAAELEPLLPAWRPHALVPVPVHWSRRLERGFNQAELLARAAGRRCRLPALPALRRTRRTRPQVGLTDRERAANVVGAFAASAPVTDRRLVLIDDVRTTGATLSECARTLLAAGAAAVYALTVTYDR
jgi:ComF family protein